MQKPPKYRWFVFSMFFMFMLLHQADKLLIGPLTTPIMETFNIDERQMGYVFSGAVLLGVIFYPIWGYLYDRYARAKLLALASLIWGVTTWLSAIAPTYGLFMATRASTGIDDSSYPGIYSLLGDYFEPKIRGKVFGLLQVTQALGYLVGMVLALVLGGIIGWRSIFYITGSLGIVLAVGIFFGVKETPRGGSEPEMAGVQQVTKYQFSWKVALELFKKRSLLMLFVQGFFGVFPWQVITFWFFRYLETERMYSSDEILVTMVVAVVVLAAGYPAGGALGDFLFKRTRRGRMIVAAFGVITGAILILLTMNIPLENRTGFMIMLSATTFFIPFASANVMSTVYDITLPEVRATSNAVQNFIEQGGSVIAPTVAGAIAATASLKVAIVSLCVSTWVICFIFLLATIYFVPKDIDTLRQQMRERAEFERQQAARGSESAGEKAFAS